MRPRVRLVGNRSSLPLWSELSTRRGRSELPHPAARLAAVMGVTRAQRLIGGTLRNLERAVNVSLLRVHIPVVCRDQPPCRGELGDGNGDLPRCAVSSLPPGAHHSPATWRGANTAACRSPRAVGAPGTCSGTYTFAFRTGIDLDQILSGSRGMTHRALSNVVVEHRTRRGARVLPVHSAIVTNTSGKLQTRCH
jgi:hypothetical protein